MRFLPDAVPHRGASRAPLRANHIWHAELKFWRKGLHNIERSRRGFYSS